MRLLITGAWNGAEKYIPQLERAGYTIVFMQQEKDALDCDPCEIQGVVCNGLFLYHDIKRFTSLKFIQLTSAGLDRVPVDYIQEKNIALFNARGVYSVPMAEHAVLSALEIFRNSRFFLKNQANRVWQKYRSLRELYGSRVCIIGCGSVGTECAKRFSALGCRVNGVDVKSFDSKFFDKIFALSDCAEATRDADIVVLCLPLTAQTEGLIDRAFLNGLKSGCVLINIARGKIIKTPDLIDALKEHRLFAALDVFDDEPLSSDSPLWSMENALITPHISFAGDGNSKRLADLIMRNLKGVAND